jgi:hypothetical protein
VEVYGLCRQALEKDPRASFTQVFEFTMRNLPDHVSAERIGKTVRRFFDGLEDKGKSEDA